MTNTETYDAAGVCSRILAEPDWRKAVAYALGFLSRAWWAQLSNSLRDHQLSESAANLLVKEFDTPNALARELLRWLRRQPPTPETLLDFVLALDQGLERVEDSHAADIIDFTTIIDESQTVQTWRARRGLLTTFDDEAKLRPKVKTDEAYTPSLDARLTTIRFLDVIHGMPPAVVETLESDVAALFDALFEDGVLSKPLRVGMFSLRGDFAPPIHYAGAIHDWHGFHLGEIDADQAPAYETAIRSLVRAASDRARGAHILVLPEFMITPAGRLILKQALVDASRDESLEPPILTIAGTCHVPIPGKGDIGNACEVYSSRGDVLWTQWKRVRFATEWPAKTAVERIRGFPPGIDAEELVRLKELIEWNGPTRVVRTPIGSLAVAICSDMITHNEGSPGVYLADLPVDCLAVPAFSDRTQPFIDRARELSRGLKVIFFVNAWPAVEIGRYQRKGRADSGEIHPPAQGTSDPKERVLASFLSTPWTGYPIEFWRDDDDRYAASGDLAYWLAITEIADGLIVDLRKLVLGTVDAHLTH